MSCHGKVSTMQVIRYGIAEIYDVYQDQRHCRHATQPSILGCYALPFMAILGALAALQRVHIAFLNSDMQQTFSDKVTSSNNYKSIISNTKYVLTYVENTPKDISTSVIR